MHNRWKIEKDAWQTTRYKKTFARLENGITISALVETIMRKGVTEYPTWRIEIDDEEGDTSLLLFMENAKTFGEAISACEAAYARFVSVCAEGVEREGGPKWCISMPRTPRRAREAIACDSGGLHAPGNGMCRF